jgi:hypothetical protein
LLILSIYQIYPYLYLTFYMHLIKDWVFLLDRGLKN